MKYKLPILTSVILALLAAFFWNQPKTKVVLAILGVRPTAPSADTNSLQRDTQVATPASPTAEPQLPLRPLDDVRLTVGEKQNAAAPRPNGQSLIVEAARNVFRLPSIEAKFRQRIDLFGHQLAGAGTYRQLGSGDIKLLRLELKLQVGEQVTNLLQVCDGRFLWIRRDSPPTTVLNRIDLKDVRRAIEGQTDESVTDWSRHWMTLGGLSKLLRGLDDQYDFGAATQQQLSVSTNETIPVWNLRGTLKATRLAELLPSQRDKIAAGQPVRYDALPAQWPNQVSICLGREDKLALFPFRIEFQRVIPKPGANKNGSAREETWESSTASSLVTLEFFDVIAGKLRDESLFTYVPGNQEVFDDTDRFLRSLNLVERP